MMRNLLRSPFGNLELPIEAHWDDWSSQERKRVILVPNHFLYTIRSRFFNFSFFFIFSILDAIQISSISMDRGRHEKFFCVEVRSKEYVVGKIIEIY